ncbi:hypothetical protein T265_11620 [Opisthorchis viverrini]|uniref:Uncharacterized protein n=1 Tax=Opisthorchis viverrini TaxID=6198 RepID=A0A074Z2F7_OPIVI|nr:hypothetical protein T265_11620 [Opisthorchis viverrini]KER19672.1 hypothetical protein T265_11620 [Opisthorchis viverrini]
MCSHLITEHLEVTLEDYHAKLELCSNNTTVACLIQRGSYHQMNSKLSGTPALRKFLDIPDQETMTEASSLFRGRNPKNVPRFRKELLFRVQYPDQSETNAGLSDSAMENWFLFGGSLLSCGIHCTNKIEAPGVEQRVKRVSYLAYLVVL